VALPPDEVRLHRRGGAGADEDRRRGGHRPAAGRAHRRPRRPGDDPAGGGGGEGGPDQGPVGRHRGPAPDRGRGAGDHAREVCRARAAGRRMRAGAGRGTPWTGGVLAALMGLSALAAFLWPLGFTLFVPLAGLLCAPFAWRGAAPPPMLALLALAGAAMVSVAWSPVFGGLDGIAGYEDLERQTWVKLPLQLALYASVVFAAVRLSRASAGR